METELKRALYNPDGSLLMKQWNDKLVVKGKSESAIPTEHSGPLNAVHAADSHFEEQLLDEPDGYEERYLGEIGYNWVTEIDY